jgi:8-oxo-dGTP pyrophosphatase MutT (NUDIX family)
MAARADLVACWVYRVDEAGRLQILLVHRAPGRVYPGLWQCVTGGLEPGETMVAGALRELVEETGLGPREIEVFGETDIINWFHEAGRDAVLCEVVFAARVTPAATVTLSHEHDDLRWCSPEEAHELVVWPAYHRAIEQIEWLFGHPDEAEVYQLTLPS